MALKKWKNATLPCKIINDNSAKIACFILNCRIDDNEL